MHGLINRSIQCFVCDTYGKETWREIIHAADIGFENFEALLTYDDSVTDKILQAASINLETPTDMILEDIGTYLVSNPRMSALRRLLRLGGENFVDFLYSLDELHSRARLAVDDLRFPMLELRDHFSTIFTLWVHHKRAGFGHVLVGVLRAMADDYGALAVLEYKGRRDDVETISIEVLLSDFSAGNDFALAEAVA